MGSFDYASSSLPKPGSVPAEGSAGSLSRWRSFSQASSWSGCKDWVRSAEGQKFLSSAGRSLPVMWARILFCASWGRLWEGLSGII